MNRMNGGKSPPARSQWGSKDDEGQYPHCEGHPSLLSGVVPRTRLYSQLDKGRGGVTFWVDGPPGCGKTTLVSGYLEASKLPCLWYDVDGRDADPATFSTISGPPSGRPCRESAGRCRPFRRRISRTFPPSPRYFDELFARLPRKAILVLDNFHGIPDGSPFHDVIREGLSRLPRE